LRQISRRVGIIALNWNELLKRHPRLAGLAFAELRSIDVSKTRKINGRDL
jgi:hypothetical protein